MIRTLLIASAAAVLCLTLVGCDESAPDDANYVDPNFKAPPPRPAPTPSAGPEQAPG